MQAETDLTPLVYERFARQHRTDYTSDLFKARTSLECIAEHSQRSGSCSTNSRHEWLAPTSYHAVNFAVAIGLLFGNVVLYLANLLYLFTWNSFSQHPELGHGWLSVPSRLSASESQERFPTTNGWRLKTPGQLIIRRRHEKLQAIDNGGRTTFRSRLRANKFP